MGNALDSVEMLQKPLVWTSPPMSTSGICVLIRLTPDGSNRAICLF